MKKWLIVILIVVIGGVAGYLYVFHKPHRDVQSEEASVALNAKELLDAYTANTSEANTLYLDKVASIKGIITEVDENHLILEPGVYCTMVEGFDGANLNNGDKVVVKGRIVSFDELFSEVRVDNAAVVTQ